MVYIIVYTLYSKQHNIIHYTLYVYYLHYPHYPLYSIHCTMYIIYYTLYIRQYTLYILVFMIPVYRRLSVCALIKILKFAIGCLKKIMLRIRICVRSLGSVSRWSQCEFRNRIPRIKNADLRVYQAPERQYSQCL